MDRKRWFAGFVGSVMVFMTMFAGGCKRTVSVDSRWASEDIVVDGQDSEWRNGGLYYDEKTNTKIGIKNDAKNLYVCLICKDGNIQRQILQRGFTIWISRDKRKNKLWGLRYPTGAEGFGDMAGPGGSEGRGALNNPGNNSAGNMDGDRYLGGSGGSGPSPGGGQGGPGGEPGGQGNRLFASSQDFELLSSENEPGRVVQSEELASLGIEERFSQKKDGGLIYEIKIPLGKTEETPYAAIPSKKGGYLIGLVSEKAEGPGVDGGMGGGKRGGMGDMNFRDVGADPMGGGGDMGRGGTGRGGMDSVTKASSMELWAMIQLAAAPGSEA